MKPQKCIYHSQLFFERLVSRANFSILGLRQKPSILDGYWRGPETLFFLPGEMRKGLQTLDFSFEADSLTHFGGLFLIQRPFGTETLASTAG